MFVKGSMAGQGLSWAYCAGFCDKPFLALKNVFCLPVLTGCNVVVSGLSAGGSLVYSSKQSTIRLGERQLTTFPGLGWPTLQAQEGLGFQPE